MDVRDEQNILKRIADLEKDLAVKNRELEIETALEKVRAIAMGMKVPVDMLQVCKTISLQLQSLGVKEIRNVQTAIFYQSRGTYMNYEYYARHHKTFITETIYTDHKIAKAFAAKMLKGKGEIFVTNIKGKKVKDWIAYQKGTNVFIDRYLEKADSLHYYWHSLGPVALGISTYSPLNKDELNLFNRFLNVFELAYTRYLDIEQAIAQAKEARIELALERVRARAMSMQHSDELAELVGTLFKELTRLDFSLTSCIIWIHDHEHTNDTLWISSAEMNKPAQPFRVRPFYEAFFKSIIHAWKAKDSKWIYTLTGTEKKKFETAFFKELPNLPDALRKALKIPKQVVFSASFSNFGALEIVETQALTDEKFDILHRFGKVFDSSYTRFNDLKKAEAQAREAQIELGLERVRARAMAMQGSNELSELVDTVFKELTKLDFALTWCIINIIDEPSLTNTVWAANPDIDKTPESYYMKFEDYPFHHAMMKGWKERKTKYVYTLEGLEKKVYDEYLFNETEFRKVPEAAQAASRAIEKYVVSFSFSNFGGLQTVGDVPLSDANLDILSRFGKVFDLTYTRFNDLKQAEAQAREAEIELALERVRARTMAMQRSEDLVEAASLLFKQIADLGTKSWSSGFIIFQPEDISINSWMSKPDGSMGLPFNIPLTEDPFFINIYEAMQRGEEFYVMESGGKELEETYRYMFSLPGAGKAMGAIESLGFQMPTFQITHCAFFPQGFLMFITYHHCQEMWDIFKRFGKVFEQTYTRFLDLQKAEAQVKESQIQLALERVRARTMAMQHSDELKDAAALLFQQAKTLGVPAYSCGYNIWEKDEKVFTSWMSTQDGSDFNAVLNIPLTEDANFIRYVESKQKSELFFVLELRGERMQEHYRYLKTIPAFKAYFDYALKAGIAIPETQIHHLVNFSQGNLLFITLEPCPEFHDVFKRFASVFEQTYTRFLDLQKAEAQAREAQIELGLERVRARAMAMQNSAELAELVATVFKELTYLDFTLAGCIIWIHDHDQSRNTLWLTSAEMNKPADPFQVQPFYIPFFKSIIHAWKSKDSKWIYKFTGTEKKLFEEAFFKELPNLPEALRKALQVPEQVVFSASYNSFGALQIVETEVLTDEKFDILHRFGKVFNSSYTRFNDLQKAEAQAREAKIEAALEKVRARTMAMQHSDHLSETAFVLFKQFKELGESPERIFIATFDEEDDSLIDLWGTNEGGNKLDKLIKVPANEPTVISKIITAWKEKKKSVIIDLSGNELNEYLHFLKSSGMPVTEGVMSNRRVQTVACFSKGVLGVTTPEPESIESVKLLERFAGAFDLAYIRFLDLQKAEAQSRETQIELGLERVRAKTMAMQRSEELPEAANNLFLQVQSLGIPAWSAGYCIWDEDKQGITLWMSSEGVMQPSAHAPCTEDLSFIHMREACERGDAFHVEELGGEALVTHYKYMRTLPVVGEILDSIIAAGHPLPTFQIFHCVYFSQGFLLFITYESVPEAHNIFKRFTNVFEQTYTRFLDLQKAEAQAREAQIEAALERVRSRTMGMQKSEELKEVIQVVYEQFVHLNILIEHTGFIMDYKARDDMNIWLADQHEVPSQVTIPYFDCAHWNSFNEAKEKGMDFFANHLTFEEKNKFYQDLFKSIPGLPEEAKEYYFSCPGLVISTVLLENVGLYIENFSGISYSDEENATLMRFGKVFQQTYTRFLDLQKAEAQARESQIQLAMERVRARTMAMQRSEELAETVTVLFQQFSALGESPERMAIEIVNEKENVFDIWATQHGGLQLNQLLKASLDEPHVMQKMYAAWKAQTKSITIDLQGNELEEYFQYLKKAGLPVQRDVFGKRRVQNVATFSKGTLTIITPEPRPQETIEILKRFAAVFDQTYTRFLDLQKAEAQAREAKIETALERVRSRTMAMQQSTELADTASVLFHQIKELGFETWSCGFCIWTKNDLAEVWMAADSGGLLPPMMIPYKEEPTHAEIYAASLRREPAHDKIWEGKELERHYTFLKSIPSVKEAIAILEKSGLKLPTKQCYYVGFFKQGYLLLITKEPNAALKDLSKRFASVFDLTYTRFNDLKIAETQAQQSALDLIKLKEEKQRTENALAELQLTQKQLIQAEKMASLGELTAGIAHEIQNPLNFVNNFSEVNKELLIEMNEEIGKGNYEEVKAIANDVTANEKKINFHGKRADAIVKGMLQHSRTSSGVKEPTDINALADEYLRLAYHGLRAKDKSFNATLKTDFDQTIGNINIIPQDIGRVILNLITNAFYVVTEKKKEKQDGYEPTVTVATKLVIPPSGGTRGVEIKVKDNGNGVPQKLIDKIFQPFFTTKPTGQGTGLGLSLSYDIIKAHDGELKVNTEEGEGSEFTIILPSE